jgi:hypothetical protein
MYKPLAQRHSEALAQLDRLRSLAREQTEAALNVIIKIMMQDAVDNRTRLMAAGMLLDRGWGKPHQTLIEGAPASVTARKILGQAGQPALGSFPQP